MAELDAMDPREFVEWQAFYALEPWGDAVEDHRFETLCALLWSINSKQKPPVFFDRNPAPPMTLEQKLEQAFAAMEGRDFGDADD